MRERAKTGKRGSEIKAMKVRHRKRKECLGGWRERERSRRGERRVSRGVKMRRLMESKLDKKSSGSGNGPL